MKNFRKYRESENVNISELDATLQALADSGYLSRAELRVIYAALDYAEAASHD